eukprot:TRINITY_DN62078_c0_g1_i1.p1 TRINITY_DN62078_c0_g1~~TRINITY_DN62078_c0_g1_i1.p1  ORF type:complete len:590 (+),score=31.76 TRINITY_DN62078_c0_g1_i1:52-1821(+)
MAKFTNPTVFNLFAATIEGMEDTAEADIKQVLQDSPDIKFHTRVKAPCRGIVRIMLAFPSSENCDGCSLRTVVMKLWQLRTVFNVFVFLADEVLKLGDPPPNKEREEGKVGKVRATKKERKEKKKQRAEGGEIEDLKPKPEPKAVSAEEVEDLKTLQTMVRDSTNWDAALQQWAAFHQCELPVIRPEDPADNAQQPQQQTTPATPEVTCSSSSSSSASKDALPAEPMETENEPQSSRKRSFEDSQREDSQLSQLSNASGFSTASGKALPTPSKRRLSQVKHLFEGEEIVFRIRTERYGHHPYKSPKINPTVGDGIVEKFGWKVGLYDFNFEIVIFIYLTKAIVGISLAPSPTRLKTAAEQFDDNNHALYQARKMPVKQDLRHSHGNSAMLPQIASGMAALTEFVKGDIVLDCMCGSGSTLIEAALIGDTSNRTCHCLGGDAQLTEMEVTADNSVHWLQHAKSWKLVPETAKTRSTIDACCWDATALPLRDASVDCVIIDMPFGHRCGSWKNSRDLVPRVLKELCRITRVGGRLVLLVIARKVLDELVNSGKYPIKLLRKPGAINMAGLFPVLYCMQRIENPSQQKEVGS